MTDKKRVNVTVCSDPVVLDQDATEADVYTYANNLARLLEREFGHIVLIHFGADPESTSDDRLVRERIHAIETSDEWRKLLP